MSVLIFVAQRTGWSTPRFLPSLSIPRTCTSGCVLSTLSTSKCDLVIRVDNG